MTVPASLLRFSNITLLSLLLFGCADDEAVSDLKEYQKRLANVLNVEISWSKPDTTLAFPPVSQLKVQVPQATINFRDFYAIQDCPVGTLIAERNTALGKTQLPSTRYHYEVKLLQGLEQCLESTENQQFKAQLSDWIELKRLALPMVWANLIQTSSEVRQAFSSNQRYLSYAAMQDLNEFTRAFEYLVAVPAKTHIDITQLEDSLNLLRQTEFIARVWKTQKLLLLELNKATELLAQHTANIQCINTSEKQQATYLSNVFQKFFIERIQPLAGVIDKSNYALAPTFDSLLSSASINTLLKQMIEQNLLNFTEYQSAIRQHVVLWQDLFKRCNMSPQKPQ